MERELYKELVVWKKSADRKPLVLNGARQVGKSWLLQEFGRREYKNVVRFSLDRDDEACMVFREKGCVRDILRRLSALAQVDITANDTLLIIDEIQDCPQALECLKYFCEDAPEIHVAVAGSLIGIALHESVSYPVGKVNMMRLYPMSFLEFLRALGREKMAELLEHCEWDVIEPLGSAFVELLREYYYVGGMPSAVLAYLNQEGLQGVRRVQKEILSAYEQDFSKHAPKEEIPRLQMVWRNIPSQLAKENKKFIYGALKKGARAASFEVAIEWLINAGIVYKINRVNAVKMPPKFYEDFNAFKLFVLDIGLMGAMVDAPAAAVLIGNGIFSEYKGAFAELYVCQQLMSSGTPTFYHTIDGSRIELDFVIQTDDKVLPVEVKAEENLQSKSMRTFIAKHPELKGLRLSMKSYIDQGWLVNVPLYGIEGYLKK